jgi:hypothetical protein
VDRAPILPKYKSCRYLRHLVDAGTTGTGPVCLRWGSDARRKNGGKEGKMGFGRGVLLWLLGVPLPLIIVIALLWR